MCVTSQVQEQGKKELMESISALVENYFAKASTSLSDGVGKTFQSLSGSRQRLQQDAARLEENASVSAVSLQVPLAGTKRQAETVRHCYLLLWYRRGYVRT